MLRLTGSLALALLCSTAGGALAQTTPAPAAAQQQLTEAQKNAIITAELPPEEAAMKSHVMFLASDAMRGRDAGSPEFDIAAQYVASQFYEQGLRPGGDEGGYLQKVPFVTAKPVDHGSYSLLRKGGEPVALEFGKDYVPGYHPPEGKTAVTAPVVFVGYGISAPSLGRDDYKGANVKGKIVAFFGSAPSNFGGEERAHLGHPQTKARAAAAHGAIGYITIESPKARNFGFAVAGWDSPRFTWMEKSGQAHALSSIPNLGGISLAGMAKLFEGSKGSWAEIEKKAAAEETATFKPITSSASLSASYQTSVTPRPSSNVVGILPGGDPALKDEVVVLSAHLDHVGVGKPDANGDTIYNGAMDNAVGIASLIEEAKRFKQSGKKPRRTIMFLAVSGEEKGLQGADYFANNPTVAKETIVADVNLDMPVINHPFSDIIVFGAPRSTLGPIVEKAAAEIGVTISPDPMPEQGLFTRSDHYRFVQQGIPSVFLWPGLAGPGKEAFEYFFTHHYHKPSDELTQTPAFDWNSGVRFVDLNYRIARAIADADERPVWNKGDFFGTHFQGRMAK